MAFFKEELMKVKAFVFDVDGVLSPDSVLINSDGELLRSANIKDGYALQYAVKKNYPIAIITGGNADSVRKRYNALGVKDIYMASKDKVEDFKDFISKYNIDPATVLYMGDDMPDYEIMTKVGVPTCPLNAVPQIREISAYISDLDGGSGCVRDVIEQVLRAHNNWVKIKSDIQSI